MTGFGQNNCIRFVFTPNQTFSKVQSKREFVPFGLPNRRLYLPTKCGGSTFYLPNERGSLYQLNEGPKEDYNWERKGDTITVRGHYYCMGYKGGTITVWGHLYSKEQITPLLLSLYILLSGTQRGCYYYVRHILFGWLDAYIYIDHSNAAVLLSLVC